MKKNVLNGESFQIVGVYHRRRSPKFFRNSSKGQNIIGNNFYEMYLKMV